MSHLNRSVFWGIGVASFLIVGFIMTMPEVGHAVPLQQTECPPASNSLNIWINEVMADNENAVIDPDDPDPELRNRFDDWFEIYNASSTTVNLQGLYLTDKDIRIEAPKFQITQPLTIEPQGFLVFWADKEREQGANHVNFNLSKDGEPLSIIAADGTTVIDCYGYGPQVTDISEGRLPDGGTPHHQLNSPTVGATNLQTSPVIQDVTRIPVEPNDEDEVVITARINDDGSVESAILYYTVNQSNMMSTTMIQQSGSTYQGTIPAQQIGTLPISSQPIGTVVTYYIRAEDDSGLVSLLPTGAPEQSFVYLIGYTAPELYLNELMANPVGIPAPPDWIEIYNPSNEAVHLDGFYLTDDLDNPTQFAIPSGYVIEPGKFFIFYDTSPTAVGLPQTNFGLNKNGEQLGLFGPFGAVMIDSTEFGPQPANISYGRFPDGVGEWGEPLCASLGIENILCDKIVYLPQIAR